MKMRKPKYPGELLVRAKEGKSVMMRKKSNKSPLTGMVEGSKADMKMDKKIAKKVGKMAKKVMKKKK